MYFSIRPKIIRRENPPKISKNIIRKLDMIPNDHIVIPASIKNNPAANAAFPSQSIFSLLMEPNSFRYLYDQITPITPIGIFIQKMDRQPRYEVKKPPATNPNIEPNTIAV